jgi:hypothetical protein
MSKLLMLLVTFFVIDSISAETIGNVEYNLPKETREWKIKRNAVNPKDNSSVVIWAPVNSDDQSATLESFGVYMNKIPFNTDKAAFEKGLQGNFADQTVTVDVLDEKPGSVLYEWWVMEDTNEKYHGWTRVISNTDQTVMLMYYTDQIAKLSPIRRLWIPALKEAKVKER